MRLEGTVSAFDHHEGLGWIDDGAGERFLFHCAELLDGTRDVAVGAKVTFEAATRFGRQEAARIEKC